MTAKLRWASEDYFGCKQYASSPVAAPEDIYVITPVFSTVYANRINGYTVLFQSMSPGASGTGTLTEEQLGTRNFGRSYSDGTQDKRMGERYLVDAKRVADEHAEEGRVR